MKYQLIDNKPASQYEFDIDGEQALIEYIRAGNKIVLTHTEVPANLEGRGIGTELVKETLDDIRSQDLELIPLCPFVAQYIQDHPEYKSLVLKGSDFQ